MSENKNEIPQVGKSHSGVSQTAPSDSEGGKTDICGGGDVTMSSGKSVDLLAENPFSRRGIQRTPPRARHLSIADDKTDAQEETEQANKRIRLENSPKKTKGAERGEFLEGIAFKRQLDSICTQVRALEKVLSDTYKPKKELLDISKRMVYHVRQIQNEDHRKWLEAKIVEKSDGTKEELRLEIANLKEELAKKNTEAKTTGNEGTSIGIQVDIKDIEEEQAKRKNKVKEKIKTILSTEKNFSNLTKIIDEDWPDDSYTATKIKKWKSLTQDKGEDEAVFMDAAANSQGHILEEIRSKFPSIAPIVEEGLTEGCLEYVRMHIGVMSSRVSTEETKYNNTIYALPMKIDGSGVDDVETVYKLCTQVRDDALKNNKNSLKISVIGDTNMDYIRKCVEYTFRDTKLEGMLCAEMAEKIGKKGENYAPRARKPENEKMIIKAQEGKSYADLLRTVKRSVDIESTGITVKTIRKTNKGDLCLEIMGGGGKAATLKKNIQKNSENTEVVIKTNDMVIHITDIDASIDATELKSEIMKAENLPDHYVRVISLRPTQNGNQTATAAIKWDVANAITNRGKIKIGWVQCRVRKRVNIQRCYRCHLFGHNRDDCTGEDRTEHCLNCTEIGHRAVDCKKTPKCIICNEDGHRSDQTKCPQFRKLIKSRTSHTSATVLRSNQNK